MSEEDNYRRLLAKYHILDLNIFKAMEYIGRKSYETQRYSPQRKTALILNEDEVMELTSILRHKGELG